MCRGCGRFFVELKGMLRSWILCHLDIVPGTSLRNFITGGVIFFGPLGSSLVKRLTHHQRQLRQ